MTYRLSPVTENHQLQTADLLLTACAYPFPASLEAAMTPKHKALSASSAEPETLRCSNPQICPIGTDVRHVQFEPNHTQSRNGSDRVRDGKYFSVGAERSRHQQSRKRRKRKVFL